MIDIRNSIDRFNLLRFNKDKRFEEVGKVITFSYTEWVTEEIIILDTGSSYPVFVDLIGRSQNTKVKALYWQHFNNNNLTYLSKVFNFSVKPSLIKDNSNNLYASIDKLPDFESAPLQIAVKIDSHMNIVYIAIFYLIYQDKSNIAKLYIHGIWEVAGNGKLFQLEEFTE